MGKVLEQRAKAVHVQHWISYVSVRCGTGVQRAQLAAGVRHPLASQCLYTYNVILPRNLIFIARHIL